MSTFFSFWASFFPPWNFLEEWSKTTRVYSGLSKKRLSFQCPFAAYNCRKRLELNVRNDVGDIRRSLGLLKCLQILLKQCNSVYNVLFGCATILLISYVVLCTYGAIRFHGLIAASFACIGTSCTVFLAILLAIMAEFNSKSKVLLVAFRRSIVSSRNFATRMEFEMVRRHVRALTALKFHVGGLYFVDKAIVMTTFKIIFDFTVNLLILHR